MQRHFLGDLQPSELWVGPAVGCVWCLTCVQTPIAPIQAAQTFAHCRRVAPHRLAGMDVFSSVLYTLRRPADLGVLAQEVWLGTMHRRGG